MFHKMDWASSITFPPKLLRFNNAETQTHEHNDLDKSPNHFANRDTWNCKKYATAFNRDHYLA